MKNSITLATLAILLFAGLVGCPTKTPTGTNAQLDAEPVPTTDAASDQWVLTHDQVRDMVLSAPDPTPIEVYFSPDGGCTTKIVEQFNAVQSGGTIRMLAYGFTSQDIADAAIAAKKRGVDVQAVFDKSDKFTQGSKSYDFIINKIPSWFDGKHAIMHEKVIVFDGKVVETGSFNYTISSEQHNAENCLFIHSPSVAKQYTDNWDTHKGHADPAVKP